MIAKTDHFSKDFLECYVCPLKSFVKVMPVYFSMKKIMKAMPVYVSIEFHESHHVCSLL